MKLLPTVEFPGRQVSRLTVGDNPTNGYSYIPDMVTKQEMILYHTEERLIQQLFLAESYGYTVWQPLATEFSMRALLHYRERGGKMDVIFQTHVPMDFEVNIREIAALNPLAVYHQGTQGDGFFEAGQAHILRDRIKYMQSLGLKAGFATHVPEFLQQAEEEDWGCDFYMACLQNTRKNGKGEKSTSVTGKARKTVEFDLSDRALMLDTIKKASKPCIAYKILAGGQIFLGKKPEQYRETAAKAIREVYENIKPGDIATVGIFQRDKDQLREDADLVCEALGM